MGVGAKTALGGGVGARDGPRELVSALDISFADGAVEDGVEELKVGGRRLVRPRAF